MKSIIYCRVSTKEQAEKGYSLESQKQECSKFAINNSYKIDKIFIEKGESAKTTSRTELQKLIKYTVLNKKNLSSLIIWKFDRLARNLLDQLELIKEFSTLGIRVFSVTENNEQTSVGKLMRNIIGSFAQYENDLRSERTIKGMQQSVKEGRWCWQAPIGYKNTRDYANKPLLVPNEDSGLIIDAFKLADKNIYTQSEIVSILKKQGYKKINKTLLGRIFHNPIYAGMIKVDWFDEYFDGIHKPIISKELFFKVRNTIDNKRPVYIQRKRINPDFPLRNFVKCGLCGKPLSASWNRGKKKKYPYYMCQNRDMIVRKEKLESLFYDELLKIQPQENVINLFKAIVLDVWKERQGANKSLYSKLQNQLTKLYDKKKRINEMAVEGFFDKENYKLQLKNINNDIIVKKIELNENTIDVIDIEGMLNYAQYFLSNTAELWLNAEIGLKIKLQQLIFPEEIVFDGRIYQTPAISLIFRYLQDISQPEYQVVTPFIAISNTFWYELIQNIQNIYEFKKMAVAS